MVVAINSQFLNKTFQKEITVVVYRMCFRLINVVN